MAFEPSDRAKFAEAAEYRDPARDLLARAVQIRPFPHERPDLGRRIRERLDLVPDTSEEPPLSNGLDFVLRSDLHSIGDTYWGPGDPGAPGLLGWNQTVRDPVNVVDARVGVQGEDWSVTVWSKNLFDEEYNDEFSHPFVWKALPQRWGVQYTKSF